MNGPKGIDLDVLEHLLTLESSLPVAYKLVLKLPYPVHDDQGSAKFDKSLHTLAVTLPVKASKESVSRLVSVDSGIGLEFDEQCDQDQGNIFYDFESTLPRNELLCQLLGGMGSNGFHIK